MLDLRTSRSRNFSSSATFSYELNAPGAELTENVRANLECTADDIALFLAVPNADPDLR
jgi:hypothetical protein